MLEGIRVVTQNWIGRTIMTIIMGFLILSFAIWGIGDMFRGFGSNTVARVGDVSLSGDTLRAAYQNELTRYQRQMRQAINNEQARAMGLDTAVVSRLVTESLLDQKAQRLGLSISDATIADAIKADPTFRGANGAFDRARFDAAIRDAGYSEQGFVREQRNVYLRREIGEAVAGGMTAPTTLLAAIDRYRTETRTIEAVAFPAAAAGEIPAATPEQLQKYFDDRKANFRAPAYRKLVVLAVTPKTAAKPQDVPEDEARKLYEQVKTQRFGTAEQRRVLQLVFPDMAQAEAAAARLKEGATFESLMADRGAKEADIDLGLRAKTGFFDKAIGEAAFALPAGGVSAPIKGEFGAVLLQVKEIAPESTKPFAEVSEELRREIAEKRAADVVRDIHDKIEDQRASGKPLAEAAAAAGLTPQTIEAVDATGRDKAGKPVDLPEAQALLKAAFASDIGVDNDTLTTQDRGYVWFEVAGVERARDRTLDEVRATVEAEWKADETARRLQARTAEAIKAIAGGKTLAQVAEAEKLEVRTIGGVRRSGGPGLVPGVVAQVFNVKPGEAGSAATPDGGRLLFVVKDSVVPKFDPKAKENEAIAEQLRSALPDDILAQYLSRLQSDAKVAIDDQAVKRAIFGAEQN